jgi:hypothetical protein
VNAPVLGNKINKMKEEKYKLQNDWTIELSIDFVKLSELGCMTPELEEVFVLRLMQFFQDFKTFPVVGDTIRFNTEDNWYMCELKERNIYLSEKIIQFDFKHIMNQQYSWFSQLK